MGAVQRGQPRSIAKLYDQGRKFIVKLYGQGLQIHRQAVRLGLADTSRLLPAPLLVCSPGLTHPGERTSRPPAAAAPHFDGYPDMVLTYIGGCEGVRLTPLPPSHCRRSQSPSGWGWSPMVQPGSADFQIIFCINRPPRYPWLWVLRKGAFLLKNREEVDE